MSKRTARMRHPAAELNITAFMNLMVVLVPFLLMTAVFTQITVLDLKLPPPDALNKPQPEQKPYELRLTIRADSLVLSDNRVGLIKQFARRDGKHDFARLKSALKQDLIEAMDSSRSYRTQVEGEWVFAELFPNISIGDAARQVAK